MSPAWRWHRENGARNHQRAISLRLACLYLRTEERRESNGWSVCECVCVGRVGKSDMMYDTWESMLQHWQQGTKSCPQTDSDVGGCLHGAIWAIRQIHSSHATETPTPPHCAFPAGRAAFTGQRAAASAFESLCLVKNITSMTYRNKTVHSNGTWSDAGCLWQTTGFRRVSNKQTH